MITFESFSNIRNLKFSDDTGQRIDVVADIEGVGKDIPFTAVNGDPEPYGHELYAAVIAGTYGTIQPYTPPPVTAEMLANQARQLRDKFISITDKFVITDYTINDVYLSDVQRQELFAVRLDFKKWPSQPDWPSIPLPAIPEWIGNEIINRGYEIPSWSVK